MENITPPEKVKRSERNKRSNPKRDPEQRNPHFSFTVEVGKGEESRLENIQRRLSNAKLALGIDWKTTSTQNADVLEGILSAFEMMRPSAAEKSPSSPTSSSTSTVTEEHPARDRLTSSCNVRRPTPTRHPRKRQIYVEATADDWSYVCTGEALRSLVQYFVNRGSYSARCEFCGGPYKMGSFHLSRQNHVCRLMLSCWCNDSVVWLLGHPAKYLANVR